MHRATAIAETTLRLLLFAFLLWLPLPFGSVIESAQPPLVIVPLYLFAAACLVRLFDRQPLAAGGVYLTWAFAGLLMVAVVGAQLVPLPEQVLQGVSPQAHSIWKSAGDVYRLLEADGQFRERFPLSVAPPRTLLHLLRLMAYVALFHCGFLLIRRRRHRLQLASVLTTAALFEVLYGLQQLDEVTPMVWGWQNTKIVNRVTGTYVNPNHYAHYLAITLPLAIYLGLTVFGGSGEAGRPTRLRRFLERQLLPVALAIVGVVGSLAGILVAQSRGALLALIVSLFVVVGASSIPTRIQSAMGARMRYAAPLAAAVILALAVLALVQYFGYQETLARFEPLPEERATLVGRRFGIGAAFGIWRLFPVFGSGMGTFEDVVLMRQSPDIPFVFTHAHNDYAEIAATTGIPGLIGVLGVLAGYLLLWRVLLASRELHSRMTREQRLFVLLGLVSLTTVALHALIDFNFFIPANAATAACIAGVLAAAAAPREEEARHSGLNQGNR